MSPEINRINATLDYLQKYQGPITEELTAQRDMFSEIPTEIISVIGSFLSIKDLKNLGSISRHFSNLENSTPITQLWEKITKELKINAIGATKHPKQKVKYYCTNIWERILMREIPLNPIDDKENAFIYSMIDEKTATSRAISGILRRGSNQLALKAISLARELSSEHLADALDCNLPKEIFEAILTKMVNVPESAVVTAINHGDIDIFSILLKKSSLSPQWLFNKSLEMNRHKNASYLLTTYPTIVVSVTDLVNTAKAINPSEEFFAILLRHHLNNKDNVISFKTVQEIDYAIETQLKICFAPHSQNTETIFELIAKAYIQTNKINSLELLTDNLDVKVFVRGDKNITMSAKLIQAVADFEKSEEQ